MSFVLLAWDRASDFEMVNSLLGLIKHGDCQRWFAKKSSTVCEHYGSDSTFLVVAKYAVK